MGEKGVYNYDKNRQKWKKQVNIYWILSRGKILATFLTYRSKNVAKKNDKYTERQKKLITSSEWHSLKSKASTWIIFGHRLGKFVLNKLHVKKQKFTSVKEEKNVIKSQEVNFQKSQKLLAFRAGSSKQTKAGTACT